MMQLIAGGQGDLNHREIMYHKFIFIKTVFFV